MMMKRVIVVVAVVAVVAAVSLTPVHGQAPARGPQPAPTIAGEWTGNWSSYNPARGADAPKELCAKLDATVVKSETGWQATFTGDCGRPYKYSITMEGRQVGGVVLFKGTADLGVRDGGVYDWIGRANDQEFVGLLTSAAYTGVFNMTKVKKGP